MRLLWDLYWPALAVALVMGVGLGVIALRPRRHRMRKWILIGVGVAATLAATALWHGPFGTAQAFRGGVERDSRAVLDHYEMTQVQARLERPLTRTLLLSGPSDDFQRAELVRIMGEVPGVGEVRWADRPRRGGFQVPMLAEATFWSLAVFCLGLLIAYVIEMRRRARADWRW